jgi:hypothetical protein
MLGLSWYPQQGDFELVDKILGLRRNTQRPRWWDHHPKIVPGKFGPRGPVPEGLGVA